MSAVLIHVAAKPVKGVQRCGDCGVVVAVSSAGVPMFKTGVRLLAERQRRVRYRAVETNGVIHGGVACEVPTNE